jgi:hypothetical protein
MDCSAKTSPRQARSVPRLAAGLCYSARMSEPTTFLFSGYARLPQDVSHQSMYKRVGVVVEVDGDGVVVGCSTTLMMPVATGFFERLLLGRNVLTERAEIEALVRYRYRGHSQGALVSALHKAFEAVDQSPLVLGEPAGPLPGARPDGTAEERH